MTFIPSSHIERKYTNGGEYQNPLTGRPHVGPYVIINSNQYFTGENYTNESVRLVSIPDAQSTPPIVAYDVLSGFRNFDLKTFTPIVYAYNPPSEQDYTLGSYKRYIAKNNSIHFGGFTEINYDTFIDLKDKEGKHDYYKYSVFTVNWNLKETLRNVDTLELLERVYPGIKLYLKIPSQFVRQR